MNAAIPQLSLKIKKSPITSAHDCYRPPSWPPPYDWVVSEDSQGNPLSRWIDSVWDFSSWAGKSFKLDFAGGRNGNSTPPLRDQNQLLLRLITTWFIWGPRGDKAWRTLKSRFGRLRRVMVFCDQKGILASDLMRYPKLLEGVAELCAHPREQQKLLVELDRLRYAKDQIGFTLFDEPGISKLATAIKRRGEKDPEQTAYIPTRIWKYQVFRLKECLEDFLTYKHQIEDCFNFCINAYAHNFGSLEAALLSKGPTSKLLPFTEQRHKRSGARTGRQFHGHFSITAARFGIEGPLTKWIAPDIKKASIKSFSGYLTLIQYAALAYIANFTLQRIDEAAALRADCLIWEEDPTVGRIPIICGETTKTDDDSNARWPTSPSVSIAVEAMSAVARLRMRCAAANPLVNCSNYDQENPALLHRAFEPWCPVVQSDYSKKPLLATYSQIIRRFPLLFEGQQIAITEDDLKQSRMLTPNLSKGGKFKAGESWPFAYHQLRRTSAVNMFASGLLCDSSIQAILKHRTLLQTAYYGRNHTRLRFNEDVSGVLSETKYEVMARQIQSLVTDRYASPAGEKQKEEMVINIIGTNDFNALVNAGRRGEISFRETRLGGCTKVGHCEYGGIESVARCAGGDGGTPCREAVFDKLKQRSIERQLQSIEHLQQAAIPDSPRRRALQAEGQGLRNYLDAIQT